MKTVILRSQHNQTDILTNDKGMKDMLMVWTVLWICSWLKILNQSYAGEKLQVCPKEMTETKERKRIS